MPAFQSLFSGQDTFLGHHRRYSLHSLETVIGECGLKVIHSGYLFLSLLLPKLIIYKMLNSDNGVDGVVNWKHGKMLTMFIERVLKIENCLLITFSKLGIRLPGLTVCALCEKP